MALLLYQNIIQIMFMNFKHTSDARHRGSKPTTLSFGSCKVSSIDPGLNKSDLFLRYIEKRLGIDFTSWKIVTDLQILKKKDQLHVYTMCFIKLVDANFNIMNVDRRTSAHVERVEPV